MILYRLYELLSSSLIKRNKIALANFVASIAVNIILWVLIIISVWGFTQYIILKYNIYFGISSLGIKYYILLLPLLGLLVIIGNFFVASVLYLNYRILSYFLVFSATIFNLAILVAGALLIYINI